MNFKTGDIDIESSDNTESCEIVIESKFMLRILNAYVPNK